MITYKVTVDENGTVRWYNENGQRHREDGPAYEYADGTRFWYLNGQRHREDGPAIEYANGDRSWYLNGKYLSEEEHRRQTQTSSCDGKVVEIDGIKYTLTAVE